MQKMAKKIVAVCMAVAMIVSTSITAFAADLTKEGTYKVNADVSLYVTAMGGIEFGEGLVTDAQVVTDAEGNMTATVNFTSSKVTIYGVDAYTFIDATASLPGYYDAEGNVHTADYTLSENTASNSSGEAIHYVDSVTFPITSVQDSYNLYLFLNSSVMGVQFGVVDGSAVRYAGILNVDWNSAEEVKTATSTSNQSADVTYTVEEGFEVEIPAQIVVDASTKVGEYNVLAKSFFLTPNAYVTVVPAANGTLSNGTDTVSFTNTLADGKLLATGDTLAGAINVTSEPATPGVYTGTTDFTINYFAE
ncbi:MAG: hypothetical protein NC397_08180 [Clostridium sp.]|nr:hypothetical protein [Clostridium sp.]